MPSRGGAGRWELHSALAVGLVICVVGFVVELRRGVEGHFLAWVYVVEWPLFAVVGTAMWWVILNEDRTPGSSSTHAPPTAPPTDIPDDAQLAAWNAYVERLQSDERDR